jgi:UDP-N-acetyl-D-galactosamine dehydrogenase
MKDSKRIAIIGLGYVGLPLAIAFAKKGYKTIGYDINHKRISELKNGVDVTCEVETEDLKIQNLTFTDQEKDLTDPNFYIVTVPTPINDANRPDLSLVIKATETLGKYIKKGDIVVYESTVYPGVTDDECIPLLESISKLKCNVDFGVGYSPERINPGDKNNRLETIQKVVSGSNEAVLKDVAEVYGSIIQAGIFKCSNIKTAEAAKVIENIQRDLNIALINELSIIFNKLDINTHDVLDAASTKWNFARFEPGLVGGHCIGVDPYYLTHCAEKLGYNPEVILSGRRINNRMGEHIGTSFMKELLKANKGITFPPTITILGFTFKENIPDIRNTKVIDIVNSLEGYGAHIQIHDPHAEEEHVFHEYGLRLTAKKDLKPADAVIVAVKHSVFTEGGWTDISSLLKDKRGLVADLKNCLPRKNKPEGIVVWNL